MDNPGKVAAEVAESFALSEFEKYRIVQDSLFESDFDRYIAYQLTLPFSEELDRAAALRRSSGGGVDAD